jgi:HAMP domain-containing protein
MATPAAPIESNAERDWWWVFDPRESLRAAAALFFGLVGVLFTLGIATLAGRSLHQSLEKTLGGAFETLAAQMNDKLDRTIFERYRTLQLAAALPALRTFDTPAAERRRVLAALQETTPDFAWIGFIDPTGRVIAATSPQLEGSSVETRAWFRGARKQPYAGSVRDDAESAKSGESVARVFDLALPVTADDGRAAGVLAAHVSWGWARDVQNSTVAETARRERIGVTVYAATGEVLLDSGGSGWTHPPDSPVLPDRKFRGSLLEPTSLGTTYLTGFHRSRGFQDYRGLGWVAAVRQPRDDAFAPVAELQRTIARWGFAFTGVSMLVAWIFAGRISRRLRSVGAAADRIHSGDVLATLPTGRGASEVERMCATLHRLIENLRGRSR